MKYTEILIVGAGAAGMMAAYTLSKAGRKVIILEARDRTGGRIHTIADEPFTQPVELGAEFIHGNLPVTLQLLEEAGITRSPAEGEMWHYRQGKFTKGYEDMEGWDILMDKLSELKEDISIKAFLDKEFGDDKYSALRKWVIKFISGYDTADVSIASAFALRNEWQSEDEEAQYRIEGGYGRMICYLADESKKNGAELILNSIVKGIYREAGAVKVILSDGSIYQSEKVVVALPLGVLQRDGIVNFHPAIPIAYKNALKQIGFGAIVKILFEFKSAFWESERITHLAGASLNEMSFILSDEEIPTWWTQYPDRSSVLTGWFGGPPAERKKHLSNDELLQQGISSLANIFKLSETELRDELIAYKVINWTTDPFTMGSYAYDTVESHQARKIFNVPIGNAIYFAGEYLYEGHAMGTVEAALTSGMEVAKKIL